MTHSLRDGTSEASSELAPAMAGNEDFSQNYQENLGKAGARLEPTTAPMQRNSCPASQWGQPAESLASIASADDGPPASAVFAANLQQKVPPWCKPARSGDHPMAPRYDAIEAILSLL